MEQDNHPKPQATESTNAGKDHTHQEGVIHSAEKISGAEEVTLVPKKTAEQRKSSSHDEKHQTSSDSKGPQPTLQPTSNAETEAKVKELIDMGFDGVLARRALEQTKDLEEAVNLIMIFQENAEGGMKAPTKDAVRELRYKMVIVARADLKMTTGKIAAQVGHAVLAAYKTALVQHPTDVEAWESIGQMKVVVRCESEKELMAVYNNARKMGLVSEYIQDAGRTQVEPGSITVCAVGPGRSDLIDQVTGHLKLY
jgi:peptidyl-tRNA hydrolase